MATTTGSVPAAAAVEPQLNGHAISTVEPSHFTCNLQVDYPTEELARIILVTMSVDPELKPDTVKREMKVEGQRLTISFSSTEARFLRASFSAFMDLLVLATRTMEEFGPNTKYINGRYQLMSIEACKCCAIHQSHSHSHHGRVIARGHDLMGDCCCKLIALPEC